MSDDFALQMGTFGGEKLSVFARAQLGIFEQALVPSSGFSFITGGMMSRSTVYSFDFPSETLSMIRGSSPGHSIDVHRDHTFKLKVPTEAQNELLRMANLIWKSDKDFARFPPGSMSWDVRLLLVDPDYVKDIHSYGAPIEEVAELFNAVVQLVDDSSLSDPQASPLGGPLA